MFDSEDLKNGSEFTKNILDIINTLRQPRGIELEIEESHRKIIKSYIDRSDIDEETKFMFLCDYQHRINEQKNRTKIFKFAIPHISHNANVQAVEEDWFSFFFDKIRLVSDEGMQILWGRILAGEINNPGTFQRSLLHTLSIMSTSNANLFSNIAQFCMREYKSNMVHPLIFISSNASVYEAVGITSNGLQELEYLGLIQCDFKDEFVFPDYKKLRYGNNIIEIFGDPQNYNKINAGNIRFTSNGLALYEIVSDDYKIYRQDLLDFALTKFRRRNCQIILHKYGKKKNIMHIIS